MATEETGPADELRKENETLRAKLVELEDKLSKLHITNEEWKAYRKVAAFLAEQAIGPEGHGDAKAEAFGGVHSGYGIAHRNPHIIKHLFHCNINQCQSKVVPAIIICGCGDLGC